MFTIPITASPNFATDSPGLDLKLEGIEAKESTDSGLPSYEVIFELTNEGTQMFEGPFLIEALQGEQSYLDWVCHFTRSGAFHVVSPGESVRFKVDFLVKPEALRFSAKRRDYSIRPPSSYNPI